MTTKKSEPVASDKGMSALANLEIPGGDTKAERMMKAEKRLGRHLHCPYCDSNTVAPNQETYRFDCTICQASWNCDGTEHTDGPQVCPKCGIKTSKPNFTCIRSLQWHVQAAPVLSERFIDLEDTEQRK